MIYTNNDEALKKMLEIVEEKVKETKSKFEKSIESTNCFKIAPKRKKNKTERKKKDTLDSQKRQ